jgi:UDP-N-acetylmuramoyl-L-alanyl-D-glutamate--2,6-diaminopimelate ligase
VVDLEKILKDILKGIEILDCSGPVDIKISGIAYNSKSVQDNYLFVSIEGFKTDGHNYIEDAIEKGATAIIIQKDIGRKLDGITYIKVRDTRLALPLISSAFFNHPESKMRIIGVTGTNGKTSTCYITGNILKKAGYKVGIIGTLGYKIGDKILEISRTTPESLDLFRILHEMANGGVDYVVMEVSSHSLELKRVEGINFYGAIFTNLTQDHLDFHGSFEEYKKAKQKLFLKNPEYSVVNMDDSSGPDMYVSNGEKATYGTHEGCDYIASNIDLNINGVSYTIEMDKDRVDLNVKIPGKFSVYNTLASFAFCSFIGIPHEVIVSALQESRGVPGRFELVSEDEPFSVIVDYAHTPDALENVLSTAREIIKGKLISVFGCGGDRDRTKRPIMGKISTTLAELTVITSDNPRSEEPISIIQEIEEGAKGGNYSFVSYPDRQEAIQYAISKAEPGDIVIIAGKGHETYQELKDKTVPFDDREVSKNFLKERVK